MLRVPGRSDQAIQYSQARVTVSEERDKRLAFALYVESGRVACTLYATAGGDTAQFSAGQDCIGGKVAFGTARIDGDTLKLELVFRELTIDNETRRGSLEYRFEGRRKK